MSRSKLPVEHDDIVDYSTLKRPAYVLLQKRIAWQGVYADYLKLLPTEGMYSQMPCLTDKRRG